MAFLIRSAVTVLPLLLPTLLLAQGTPADYARGETLAARFRDRVFRASVVPHWIEGGRKFWYAVETGPGVREFVLIDAQTGARETAFDNAKLAATLSERLDQKFDANNPSVTITAFDTKSVHLSAGGKRWTLNRATGALTEETGAAAKAANDSLPAFLPPRPSEGGEETNLTLENRSKDTVDVYWVSTGGERVKYHTLKPGASTVQHTFAGHVWLFTDPSGRPLAAYAAVDGDATAAFDGTVPQPPVRRPEGLSPDGRWRTMVKAGNLWLHPVAGGEDVQLSTDGKEGDAYERRVWWSPDGHRLAAFKTEPAQRHPISFVRSSPKDQLQPELVTFNYLKPGDKIAHPRLVMFDVDARRAVPADDTLSPNPWELSDVHWSADSREVRYVYNQRGHQVLRLLAADATTGKVRTVVEETSPTFIDYSQKLWVRYLNKTDEALWASERSGYNHLYLVNLRTGATKPVTQGPWVMRSVEDVDEGKREVTVRVMGIDPAQDPYHMHYARVGFDGKGLVRLTDGDGTHRIVPAPNGETYLDTYSRVDLAPVTELRRTRDGKKLATLETGDLSALKAQGWIAPERFVAKGRDGKTDIWGVIYRPTNFDPAKHYPVVESIYAGPHDFFVPKTFSAYRPNMRLTELGFIQVQIDGMGTNWRSRAFHDVAYQNLADAGFPDRILWMEAAATTRPWMDLDHVGVYGTSAGGQSAASAVERFGDFYKAAVADCGCHDNRMDKIWWNEAWMGWPVGPAYAANSNVTGAKDLKGKLFLMVGEVDTNVDPASTTQVANALIEAGKEFDYLVVPNSNHGVLGQPYPYRRMEEFFVRNLMREEFGR